MPDSKKSNSLKNVDLFQLIPAPCLILDVDDPRFTILDVNQSYLEVTNTSREGLIGKGLFEAFPNNPDDPHANGVKNLHRSLKIVIDSGKRHQMDIQKYDIPDRDSNSFTLK